MINGRTEISPSQAKFLAQTLDDVDLSVRASNCLKNINVKYLGELVQYRPADLLRIHNFGKTSLDEIVALFAKENLSLGLRLPSWKPELPPETVCHVASCAPHSLLTSSQRTFLARKVEDVDLSVRTFNCLVNQQIRYLGELVQYNPKELLKIQHFGQKCLREVIALFAEVDLTLGLSIPDWTPDLSGSIAAEPAQSTEIVRTSETEALSPTQKVFLAQPLSTLHLSTRIVQIMTRFKVVRVGDLAIQSTNNIRELLGYDETAFRELAGLLASEGLAFDARMNWNAALAEEWELAYPAQVKTIQRRHVMQGETVLSLEDELEQFVRQVLHKSTDRNAAIVIKFFGFDGTAKKTLEDVGTEFNVTRERVRQITSGFAHRLRGRKVYLPMFRLACNRILKSLPRPPGAISDMLCENHISRTRFDITGLVALQRLLSEDDMFDVVSISRSKLVVERGLAEGCRRVPRIARAIVSAFGCGHIEHILGELEADRGKTLGGNEVVTVLAALPEVRWLDKDRSWFTIVNTNRNRLSNIVRRVLSVAPKILIPELRAAVKRVHRLDGFAPPSDVLRAFCSSLTFCAVSHEWVIANEPLSPIETLGEVERCFCEVLREHGLVMSLSALREQCVRRGMNANSFYQYITYSPIICRLVREVYALVGAEVPPGTVEEITQSTVRGPVLVDHGWTDDGRVWISYRLNASNLRSGVFSLPASLRGKVTGNYFIQSSGTGARRAILAENDKLTGLHRPIAIRGGEQDDVIVVTFDLHHASADFQFGEKSGGVVETRTISAVSTSFGGGFAKGDPVSVIENDPPTNNLGTWQPITTAPVDQELKVRLQDSVGRYALLFPCKLIPGQGWINSWLGTPLAADPVDWQNWDQPSIDF